MYTRFSVHDLTSSISLQPLYVQKCEQVRCLSIEKDSLEIKEINSTHFDNQKPLTLGHGIVGIIELLAGSYLIIITEKVSCGSLEDSEVWKIVDVEFFKLFSRAQPHIAKKEASLLRYMKSVLIDYPCYFSYTRDLTLNMQAIHKKGEEKAALSPDSRFFWNHYLLKDNLLKSSSSSSSQYNSWILAICMGYFGHQKIVLEEGEGEINLSLFSRRSCRRPGKRMWRRGIDLNGNVANYVESEMIVETIRPDKDSGFKYDTFSFVQTRGSIPVFWTQYPDIRYKPPAILYGDKSEILRSFKLHFEEQIEKYGKQSIANLVDHKGFEFNLASEYSKVHQEFCNLSSSSSSIDADAVKYHAFDFHRECKIMKKEEALGNFLNKLGPELDEYEFFWKEKKTDHSGFSVNCLQKGVPRTNCVDNLDRTNVVQTMFVRYMIVSMLGKISLLFNPHVLSQKSPSETLKLLSNQQQLHKELVCLWADNGDAMGLQYTGTYALKGDITRSGKRTPEGLLQDGHSALKRYFLNNFTDAFDQDALDLFVGNVTLSDLRSFPSSLGFFPSILQLLFSALLVFVFFLFRTLFTMPFSYQSVIILRIVKNRGHFLVNRPMFVKLSNTVELKSKMA